MAPQKTKLVTPDQSVEHTFGQILQTNLTTARDWEPVVLAGEDPERIHQMRVCLRRMRSALAVFRTAMPPKLTRSFFKEMRWAAKTLDRARDLDVYIAENLSSKGNKLKGKMHNIALKDRKRAYEQVTGFIRGKRYKKLCNDFHHWMETQGWRMDLTEEQKDVVEGNIIPFASKVLDHQWTRVLGDGINIESLDNEALHQLRIDCKKLRYAAEFFTSLYEKPTKDFICHIKSLQDLLGTLHDAAVMPELHKDLLKNKKNRNLTHYTQKLVNLRGKQSKTLRKALNDGWSAFSNADRPWMDNAAYLA